MPAKRCGASTFLNWVRADACFSDAECDLVVRLARMYAPVAAPVGNDTVNRQTRSATLYRIAADSRSQDFYASVNTLVREINEQHFGFDLSGIRAPDVLEYSPANGHFDWHRDFAYHEEDLVRKLAVIVQLSHPEDYEGGDLDVFDAAVRTLPKERGTIVALPSFVLHRVTAVTRGCRRALVVFALGPRFR